MGPKNRTFETGDSAPEAGIYLVVHSAHRLPHEVVVSKGQKFPKCQKCGDAVLFELLHTASDLFPQRIKFIYELPVIEEDEESATG